MKPLRENHTHLVVVRLRPYLQEYLTCKFENDVTGSMKNIVGASLRPFLKYIPENKGPFDYKRVPGYNPKYFFEIPIPHYQFVNKRHFTLYLPPNHYHFFEQIIYFHFWEVFYGYVDDKIRYNSQIKLAILQFCLDYNLTFNEITYEMLKKSYYRKRGKNNSTSCGTKLSLTCPLAKMNCHD